MRTMEILERNNDDVRQNALAFLDAMFIYTHTSAQVPHTQNVTLKESSHGADYGTFSLWVACFMVPYSIKDGLG